MPTIGPNDEVVTRQFVAAMDARFSYVYTLSPEQWEQHPGLLWYNEAKEITHLRRMFLSSCNSWETEIEPNTLVLEVGYSDFLDKNGQNVGVRVWGVYFGCKSRWNTCGTADPESLANPLYTLLQSLYTALVLVEDILKRDSSIMEIIIKTNVATVLEVCAWGRNLSEIVEDWASCRDLELMFEEIEERLRLIEISKRSVQFWLLTDLYDVVDMLENYFQ
ncbi:hypothetical protein H2198_010720 [Neophaeococcomyces mojaviensis]|uniref:Uncharacterized protein n=1 Tax=Neophaeococcomyces mojaviensis TaxID=3383035 RepID=A0ACC2ZR18_9EURO|nr:hypothetical protein H2198_010720 [Knufia sp. JES_112]